MRTARRSLCPASCKSELKDLLLAQGCRKTENELNVGRLNDRSAPILSIKVFEAADVSIGSACQVQHWRDYGTQVKLLRSILDS